MSKPKRIRKFKPTFENGGFWEHYKDLEYQVEDFLKYVPYIDENKGVRSFRLTNILLNIGGHIDSAFKEMARYQKFYRRKGSKCKEIVKKVRENRQKIKRGEIPHGPSIKLCLEAFENLYKLSMKEVVFKRLPEREPILPFTQHNPKTQAPYWWDIYNNTKHDFHEYFERTNLKATRDALAGAFLLNVRHIPAALRLYDFGLVKFSMGSLLRNHFEQLLEDERRFKTPCFIETDLFRYDYVK